MEHEAGIDKPEAARRLGISEATLINEVRALERAGKLESRLILVGGHHVRRYTEDDLAVIKRDREGRGLGPTKRKARAKA